MKVVFSDFFLGLGACLEGLAEPTPKELCLHSTFGVGRIDWCSGVCFQSLARRSRYSVRPLKFECDCFLTQNAFWGSGTARHLGPTPRGRLKFGRMLACRTRTARNRRVKDARRSVTGPLSAASARYLRIGDSDFGAVKARFLEMATYNRSQTCYSSEFPPELLRGDGREKSMQ